MERSGFPETIVEAKIFARKNFCLDSYMGFGKSYLIPETTNFGIGEGIDNLNHLRQT
jgi:hypothetical protein